MSFWKTEHKIHGPTNQPGRNKYTGRKYESAERVAGAAEQKGATVGAWNSWMVEKLNFL
jgi:hypothetical protein